MPKNTRWLLAASGVVVVAALGWLGLRMHGGRAAGGTEVQAADWDGSRTYECVGRRASIRAVTVSQPKGTSGANDPTLKGCDGDRKGCPLIFAGDGCELEVVDCKLTAPIVLLATGNARVTFRNTTVQGESVWGKQSVVTGVPEHQARNRGEPGAISSMGSPPPTRAGAPRGSSNENPEDPE